MPPEKIMESPMAASGSLGHTLFEIVKDQSAEDCRHDFTPADRKALLPHQRQLFHGCPIKVL